MHRVIRSNELAVHCAVLCRIGTNHVVALRITSTVIDISTASISLQVSRGENWMLS